MINYFCYDTEIGRIKISEKDEKIIGLVFSDYKKEDEIEKETDAIRKTYLQLKEYLSGKRKNFDIEIEMIGTEFQKKVWKELLNIPYGETRSYKDIAIAIGNGKACRAVGNANNKNPIAIIVPCHRVVGSNGSMTGYAGGLDIKEKLLKIEKCSV
ncbi:methylated-DNA--[protein]-cysteine S-methyltransferase [Peptacetobacter hiranonis]|uniref:Methylated-DNA--protein-cysteine methyltransferase n=1 Tax=Peptacetobacter hiranonis (strain DSM 13275 / JCM 10541 / KCTC 15199 / TO-931) TaxID=500633 RepID=B6G0W8_PEPHT|nr:methylated-DNA--[protein]-cysteine S-methyltransferase [Peptacetobacter hiranonis]EEA84543.1 6-O-methylguanine DNA methyltransferase, DNA binding domain protein [Peptacetobacter hiranonis DSM 13275]QEK21634.1 Methylated-DNA--protein-cysteine methyltransferase, constitutive [Peptacetobacter hiranonis]